MPIAIHRVLRERPWIWPIAVSVALTFVALGLSFLIGTLPNTVGTLPRVLALPPVFWGWFSLIAFLTIGSLSTRTRNPLALAMGADGRLSTSKFQFLLWTAVALFTYGWLLAARLESGATVAGALSDIPQNLMLAMGFSITTAVSAKGITVSYVNSGRLTKAPPEGGDSFSLSGLVAKDDAGSPDLVKVQMLAWTFLAVVVYVLTVTKNLDHYVKCSGATPNCFPDIDAALMVLMGLAQGAYIGGKLTTVDTAAVSSITPATVLPGGEITITGVTFGAAQGRSVVSLAGAPVVPRTWSDTSIAVRVPLRSGGITPWQDGDTVEVAVLVDGRRASGQGTIQIAMPKIAQAAVVGDAASLTIVITGGPFGVGGDDSQLVIDGVKARAPSGTVWSDSLIRVPAAGFPRGRDIELGIDISGYASNRQLVNIRQAP